MELVTDEFFAPINQRSDRAAGGGCLHCTGHYHCSLAAGQSEDSAIAMLA